ncbi:MAG: hypothetical protein AWU57_545 [Marinobacter sp. T13-3]|nr:MAG: hypothetical protein AWU57_545 [Marinobacter sp. T13-3]
MGLYQGTATTSAGKELHFAYQSTSDCVASRAGRTPPAPSTADASGIHPVRQQPVLANLFVDYGHGLHWRAWLCEDTGEILLYTSPWEDPEYAYGQDATGTVHLITSDGYARQDWAVCGHNGKTDAIDLEEAEGRLCLTCLNKALGRNHEDDRP